MQDAPQATCTACSLRGALHATRNGFVCSVGVIDYFSLLAMSGGRLKDYNIQ